MAKLLVVEDSIDSQNLIKLALGSTHEMTFTSDLKTAREALKDQYDLIILDVLLPDGDGMTFCQKLKEEGVTAAIPVVMLTSKTEIEDRVQGLNGGADDYIPKPFDPRELRARVESVLRRKRQGSSNLQVGPIKFELAEQKAMAIVDDRPQLLDLTPIEFKVLLYLCRKAGQAVSRDELFDHVWGSNVHLSARNIDTHICKLRQKVPQGLLDIKSARGKGYILRTLVAEPKRPQPKRDVLLPHGGQAV